MILQSNLVLTIRLQRIHGYNEQNQLFGVVQHVLTTECHGYSEELF